ncbi:hypothetical protein PVAP13_6NG157303 [Panicum virgatum]|uniref:Uncharacterized protein n=1 Tax=Panicum virgatum TaxID=38727 RepID=A0A8T0QYT9_PANVG|nr:hypothetical protein PVAP13_6NG157303 [Panicum virgatum]
MYMSLDHRQVLDCDSRGAVVTLPGPANENSGCATTVTPARCCRTARVQYLQVQVASAELAGHGDDRFENAMQLYCHIFQRYVCPFHRLVINT